MSTKLCNTSDTPTIIYIIGILQRLYKALMAKSDCHLISVTWLLHNYSVVEWERAPAFSGVLCADAIRERWPWDTALSLSKWGDRRHRWWEKKGNQIAALPPHSLWEAHEAATVLLTSARLTAILPRAFRHTRSLCLWSISLPLSLFLLSESVFMNTVTCPAGTYYRNGNRKWNMTSFLSIRVANMLKYERFCAYAWLSNRESLLSFFLMCFLMVYML